MRTIRILAALSVVSTCGASPAWALGGGGTAPGGPLSGSIRPSCNGYNMDGTLNASPGADRAGCVDRSARGLHRVGSPDEPRSR